MNSVSLPYNIPYRIRIGVTGHRILQSKQQLEETVRAELDLSRMMTLFDEKSRRDIESCHTTAVAYTVVTPLAEGTDRLVAKEVLATPGALIEVVLPLSKEKYVQDFLEPDSYREFEELFNRDRRPITLSSDEPGGAGKRRDVAYAKVGRYVVDHCDVMIALWDGKPSRGLGGTAEIVEYAIQKQRPLIHVSTDPTVEPKVYRGNGLSAGSILSIEDFNLTNITDEDRVSIMHRDYDNLFSESDPEISSERKELLQQKLVPFYAKASKNAEKNQRSYVRSGTVVYSSSALAVAAVAIGVIIPEIALIAFAVEFILLLGILFVVHFVKRRDAQRKWIESRFLAERIRVAFFFAIAQIEISPVGIPPYMRTAHRPDDWMVRVFDEIWRTLPPMNGIKPGDIKKTSLCIHGHLIAHQLEYHQDKVRKAGQKNRVLEMGGVTIFVAALVAALLHIVFFNFEDHLVIVEYVLTFLAISLPALGAAVGGIHLHREYIRIEKRSESMVAAFAELMERSVDVSSDGELQNLLQETEELMLRETQDWLMLMRFVKLETAA